MTALRKWTGLRDELCARTGRNPGSAAGLFFMVQRARLAKDPRAEALAHFSLALLSLRSEAFLVARAECLQVLDCTKELSDGGMRLLENAAKEIIQEVDRCDGGPEPDSLPALEATLLALLKSGPQSTRFLMDQLYGAETPPEKAENRLKSLLHRIRERGYEIVLERGRLRLISV